ncbi:MAG: hypothetical protein QME12_08600 [Nanoarchaeota archaeon]|nr:hypothetical protein [Nanoarchaeota archaeon]
MVWGAIKLTLITSAFLGALSYGYSKVPFVLFVFAVLLLVVAFMNCIEIIPKGQ